MIFVVAETAVRVPGPPLVVSMTKNEDNGRKRGGL